MWSNYPKAYAAESERAKSNDEKWKQAYVKDWMVCPYAAQVRLKQSNGKLPPSLHFQQVKEWQSSTVLHCELWLWCPFNVVFYIIIACAVASHGEMPSSLLMAAIRTDIWRSKRTYVISCWLIKTPSVLLYSFFILFIQSWQLCLFFLTAAFFSHLL